MDARPPRRILVTGATGFIGQATIPALRARFPEAVLGGLARSERSATELAEQHLTPVRGDLAGTPETLAAGVRGFAPEAIVHLAAEIASSRDTTAIQRTNVEGTRRLAEITRQIDGFRCFLYASTVVTGDAGGRVLTEDGPFPPETAYGP